MAEQEKELNDMKYNMLDLKKKLQSTTSENHILRVKVRKLETELEKKNKHIESLIDPKKSSCIRKILTERGASLIVDLKKRNAELVQAIEAKDAYIKKIETDLQTSKTYLTSDILHNKTSYNCKYKSAENIPGLRTNSSRSRSLSITPRNVCKVPEAAIRATQHLEENIEKIKQESINSVRKTRPLTENTVTKSMININAEKINDENNSNLEILLKEMKSMKEIVYKLSLEQEHTKKLMKEKNRNIELLGRQVKQLQKLKIRRSAGTIVLQITNEKNEKIETKLNTSSYSQESFEDDDDTKNSTQLKNLSVTSHKLNESEENEDDDDVETGDSNT